MAITTLAGVRAGMIQPALVVKAVGGSVPSVSSRTYWALGGFPPAGAYNSTLNGVTLTGPVTGGIPYPNPASGNTYLAGWRGRCANFPGGLTWLCDRLWHNGGYTITSTSAQNSTTPTWPARDANGSTNGEGVFLAVEVSATTGAGTPTITISYTNSAGTAGRSATNIQATIASSGAQTVYLIRLQAGDLGVRSVQSLTLSATWTSGTINLVAYRPIYPFTAFNGLNNAQASPPVMDDALTSGFPRVFDSSVLYYMTTEMSAGGGVGINGVLRLAQG